MKNASEFESLSEHGILSGKLEEIEFPGEIAPPDPSDITEEYDLLPDESWYAVYDRLHAEGMYIEALNWVDSYNWDEKRPHISHFRWIYKAWCEDALNWIEEAISSHNKYISLEWNPTLRSISSIGLARIYGNEGRISEAMDELTSALKDAPADDPWFKEQAKETYDDLNDWFGRLLSLIILAHLIQHQRIEAL